MADRIINLCEMKFSEQPYSISKDYAFNYKNVNMIARVRL